MEEVQHVTERTCDTHQRQNVKKNCILNQSSLRPEIHRYVVGGRRLSVRSSCLAR
jgi:hypothetical protein